MNLNLNNLLLPTIALVGLILLVALDKVSATTAIPLVAGLVGVHAGATVSNTTSPSPPTVAPGSVTAPIIPGGGSNASAGGELPPPSN